MTKDELQHAADVEADDCIRYLSSLPPVEIRNRISNALRKFYDAGVQEGIATKLSLVPRRTVE